MPDLRLCVLLALVLPAFAFGAWVPVSGLPQPVYSPSCMSLSGFLFCVGGGYTSHAILPSLRYSNLGPVPNNVFMTPVTANGSAVGWSSASDYPYNTSGQVCALLSNSSIVCVGGTEHVLPGHASNSNSTPSNQTTTAQNNETIVAVPTSGTFMVPVFPGGTGGWIEIALYPFIPTMESCTTNGDHLYCVGGYNATRIDMNSSVPGNATDLVYYTTIVPGVNVSWNAATPYPDNVAGASCVSHDSYVYCIGGHTSDVYYAQVSFNGALGAWKAASPYPFSTYYQGCAVVNATVYCAGGVSPSGASVSAVYYAKFLQGGGLSQWARASSYPVNISGEGCAGVNATLYCMGGISEQRDRVINSAYELNTTYAPAPNTSTTTVPQNITVTTTTASSSSSTTTTVTTGPPTISVPPTIVSGTSTAPTSTVPQASAGGSPYLTLVIIVAVLILAVLAYVYLSRRKPKGGAVQTGNG